MCMYCKCNDLIESTTTHVVNGKDCIIIVKNVPCEECEQCGAKYYSDETARQLEKLVNTANSLCKRFHLFNRPSEALPCLPSQNALRLLTWMQSMILYMRWLVTRQDMVKRLRVC